MQIKTINRPWQRKHRQGTRYNPDPFYQSSTWKTTRHSFIHSTSTLPNGKPVSNSICYDCMAYHGRVVPMHTVDHITRIKDGGSKTDHSNLRSLCAHCHAIKSANEGNQDRKK